jgi:predicted dehydrogenase
MPERKRYAVVGLGSRSGMFTSAILKDFAERAELVGYCDVNQTRMDYYNRRYAAEIGAPPVPTYKPDAFDRMIAETRSHCVIVTSIDRTHHEYIIRAMELGCDAISEKPMTIDAPKCQAILDAIRRTGRKLTVTFNYRYAPRNSQIRQLLAEGAIGDVLSVHFEWLLDTNHGADYFRRWHRDKRNSGGLLVHKATHHFDLINWWIQSVPETVFGFGALQFYGRENAEQRGEPRSYTRAHGSPDAKDDPFALHLADHDELRELYLNAEHEDGYFRDQSVFGDGISIEDDVAVLVRYRSGATMTYHLTAYSPWEGYRVAFNGTKGRLEMETVETGYISGGQGDPNRPDLRDARELDVQSSTRLLLRPHWRKPLEIPSTETGEGGHGGGDVRMLRDIFVGPGDDPLGRTATHIDGAYSILTGIAGNHSFATGQPVRIDELVTIR